MRTTAQYFFLTTFSVVLAVVLPACSGSGTIPDGIENRTASFEPGSPSFDMDAVSTIVDGRSGVDVYVSIPHSSLVYVRSDGGFEATYDAYVSITPEGADDAVYQETWTDTVFAESYETTKSFGRLLRRERVDLSAGGYVLEIALEDAESGAQAVRRQNVDVLQPGTGGVSLSEILLRTSREGGPFEPTVSIHVPQRYDSLQAVTQLYNIPDTARVRLALVRFASDTTVATPPHWFTPSHFTLPYMGIDYERHDTVQVSPRTVHDSERELRIEFDLPALEKGVYMVAIRLEATDKPVETRRYFTVQSPSFPQIASLEEMVGSLAYIARDAEMEHIRAADSPEEMKRRFDAFWAERMPNRQAAANLLALYYERVEEANLLFSNHKDGWKTDRGMIYIVFGPPAYIDNRYTRRDWYYYDQGAIVSRAMPPFIFRRSTAYGLAGLFENYVLQRSERYEEEWRRRRDDWRSGRVL